MKYKLQHQKADGSIEDSKGYLGYLAFAKHMVFSGFGANPPLLNIFRYLAMTFELNQYWYNNPKHFSIPPPFNNDPTERAYLSNRIGRAYADFLSKKIYRARFTHSYEDAMAVRGIPIKGERPDFYCVTDSHQFSVESKGFGRKYVSSKDMDKYKLQAGEGKIGVHFSVASVAYDLYSSPKVKFYDPVNENGKFDTEENLLLRSQYFNSVLQMVNSFGHLNDQYGDTDYYRFDFPELSSIKLPFKLLVHRAIVHREWDSDDWFPRSQESNIEKNGNHIKYIDLDGIGLEQS